MMESFIAFLDNYWLALVCGVLVISLCVTGLCTLHQRYPELDKAWEEHVIDDSDYEAADASEDRKAYGNALFWVGVSTIFLSTICFVLDLYLLTIHHSGWSYTTFRFATLTLAGIIAILESYGYASFNSCRTYLVLTSAWTAFFEDDGIPTGTTGAVIRVFHLHVVAVWFNVYSMQHSMAVDWVAIGATLVSSLLPSGWHISFGIPLWLDAMARLFCDYGILCFTSGVVFTAMGYQLGEASTETNEKEQVNQHNELDDLEQPLLAKEKEVITIGVGVMMNN